MPCKSKAKVSPKKIIIGLGVAAIAAYAIFKGTSLKETAENIRISLAALPKIHKIDLSGLKISLSLKVDNPAQGRVTVKLPSIRGFYKGKLLASTSVSNKTYTIEPVSTTNINDIMIEVSYLSLLTSAPTIVSDFTKQGTSLVSSFGFEVLAEVNGIPLKVQKL